MTDLLVAFAALRTAAARLREVASDLAGGEEPPLPIPEAVGHAPLAARLAAITADLEVRRRGVALRLEQLAEDCLTVGTVLADADLRLADARTAPDPLRSAAGGS